MKGLFQCFDADGIFYLLFFRDNRVLYYSRYNRFDQQLHSFPGLRLESENVYCFRGIYQVDIWDNVRIVIKGDFGKMVYRGFIRDEDIVFLICRCPFTCAKKSATFVRCAEQKDNIGKEFGDICIN